MEKLIKNALGQWKLIKEELIKAPQQPQKPAAAAPPTTQVIDKPETPNLNLDPTLKNPPALPGIKTHNDKITSMFANMAAAHTKGDIDAVKAHKGELKDFILSLPKGQIDLGHIGKLREKLPKAKNIEGRQYSARAFSHSDMEDIINHHFNDAKSIKDMHDRAGGIDAVETLMRTMGANGDPKEYSNLKFKKLGLHEDLLDLVNPGKSKFYRENGRRDGIPQRPYLDGTEIMPDHQKKVIDTWNSLYDEENGHDNPSKTKAHEDAVVERGLNLFKRHHKLT